MRFAESNRHLSGRLQCRWRPYAKSGMLHEAREPVSGEPGHKCRFHRVDDDRITKPPREVLTSVFQSEPFS
jgi:hypothetical protein